MGVVLLFRNTSVRAVKARVHLEVQVWIYNNLRYKRPMLPGGLRHPGMNNASLDSPWVLDLDGQSRHTASIWSNVAMYEYQTELVVDWKAFCTGLRIHAPDRCWCWNGSRKGVRSATCKFALASVQLFGTAYNDFAKPSISVLDIYALKAVQIIRPVCGIENLRPTNLALAHIGDS